MLFYLIVTEIVRIFLNRDKENKAEEEENVKKDKSMGEEKEDIDIKNFEKIKNYIFEEFANKLDNENDIKNIIKLIDYLKGKNDNNLENKDNKTKMKKI